MTHPVGSPRLFACAWRQHCAAAPSAASWTVQHLFACTWRQQSAKGPKKRSELLESSLSWRALSHGIGRCGNLVSFLILFDPVFANLHFTVSRSFSCSHMGENCRADIRAETSNKLVEPQFPNFQSDPSMCLWHFSPNSMATLRVS